MATVKGTNSKCLQKVTLMYDDLPPAESRDVPASRGQAEGVAYNAGVAAGCLGCFSVVVLATLGFITGCSLVGLAHEHEWFYTQAEFKNRHGLSDSGLVAFGNMVNGGLVGAVLLPVAGAAAFIWVRSSKKRRLKSVP